MAEEEVGLRLSLKDRRQTSAGLRDVRGDLDGVGRSADSAGRRASLGARGFDAMRRSGRLAGQAIKVGFGVALAAGYAATRLLSSAFDEAREAQKVGALTRSVIKSTGGAANVTARQVERLSGRLSRLAGVDDELIQTGANLLLTFKNVRNEVGKGNDVFNQAMLAAVDLSAAGFGSVESASKMLGKALNDPVKGMSAMGRAGVTFSAQQQDRIKALVEENDLLGAQRIILGEVQSQVGGAARSQRTWGDVAKVTFDNILETLGTGLLPVLDRANRWFVKKGAPQLEHYLGIFVDKGVPAIGRFARKAQPVAERILPKIGDTLGTIGGVLADAAPYAERLLNAFVDMPSWAKKAIAGGGLAAVAGSKTGLFSGLKGALGGKGGGGVLGALSAAKPVPVFVTNPGFGGGDVPSGGKVKKTVGLGLEKVLPFGKAALPAAGPLAAILGGLWAVDKTKEPIFGSRPAEVAAAGQADYETRQAAEQGHVGAAYAQANAHVDTMTESLNPLSMVVDDIHTKLGMTWGNPFDKLTTSVQASDIYTKSYGKGLDKVAATKVAPKFSTPGLPGAQSTTKDYKDRLRDISRPVNTHIGADTSAANGALDRLSARLTAMAQRKYTMLLGAITGKASGGPVVGGEPYVVGERRPELFVPKTDGYILPRVPPQYSAPDMPADVDDDSLRGIGGGPIHVHVMLDRREVALAVLDGVQDREARR